MTDTTIATRTYTEREAARALGIDPAKLRYWRLHQFLADGVVLESLSPPAGARQVQRYSAELVDAGTIFKAAS
jgi:hypothetical protein